MTTYHIASLLIYVHVCIFCQLLKLFIVIFFSSNFRTTVIDISDYLQKNDFFKKLWDSRSKFDDIILLDENGFDSDQSVLNKDHPLQILKDAMLKVR